MRAAITSVVEIRILMFLLRIASDSSGSVAYCMPEASAFCASSSLPAVRWDSPSCRLAHAETALKAEAIANFSLVWAASCDPRCASAVPPNAFPSAASACSSSSVDVALVNFDPDAIKSSHRDVR